MTRLQQMSRKAHAGDETVQRTGEYQSTKVRRGVTSSGRKAIEMEKRHTAGSWGRSAMSLP